MIRNFAFAAVAATTMLAGPLLIGGPAFAGVNSDSPPMPYTAPDPVYTPHKVVSTVDMRQPKDTAVLTNSGNDSGSASSDTK